MQCKQCGTDLICKTKDYGGNYPPALQWQNADGTAHYKTEDGKNYTCTLPDDEVGPVHATADAPGQTQIVRTAGDAPSNLSHIELSLISQLNEKLDHAIDILERVDEMSQAVFRYTIDQQLRKKQ